MILFRRLFERSWLPVFLLLSTTWLYAPWLHGVRIGHLTVVSVYESLGGVYNLFRAADLAAAVLLLVALAAIRLWRRDNWLAWLIGLYAGLSIVDIIFTSGCNLQSCGLFEQFSYYVHDTESALSAVILAVAVGYDAFRFRRRTSLLFLIAQIVLGLLIVLNIFDHNQAVASQYFYQTTVFLWLGLTLQRYYPTVEISARTQTVIRRALSLWVAVSGILSILTSLHTRLIGHLSHFGIAGQDVNLAQHGVITGILLLYVSRHIAQGQRRAAWLVQLLFISLIIKFSLFEPRPVALLLSTLSSLVLLYGWQAFRRNSLRSNLVDRLQDGLIVLGGVLLALLLVAGLFGIQHRPYHRLEERYDRYQSREHREADHHKASRDYDLVAQTLVVSSLVAVAWGFFRPTTLKRHHDAGDVPVEALLQRYAQSSEDYFKLWPQDKQYFTLPERPDAGFIAYRQSGTTVFALPGPIGRNAVRPELMRAFESFCTERGLFICFLAVEEPDRTWYESFGFRALQIGSSARIDITTFAQQTVRDKWWRWQMNRAAKQGSSFDISVPPHSPELLAETKRVSDAWLTRPGHSEQGFALGAYDDDYLQAGRLLLLRNEAGELIAFANELPVYNNLKTATVDMIRFLPEENGAMPVLIANYIRTLAEENRFKTFDLGFVPLAKLDSRLGRTAKRILSNRFSAGGLEQFKSKFKPDWRPVYLAYNGDLINLANVMLNLERVLDDHRPENK